MKLSITSITRRLYLPGYQYLSHINIFPSNPPSTDPHQVQNQLISTRLFIILYAYSLGILLVYTSSMLIAETHTVTSPSFQQYTELYGKRSQTTSCPCSTIAIPYEKLIDVNYTLHQLCSSYFVSDQWIKLLDLTAAPLWNSIDFRVTGLFAFQALRSFCNLVNNTIVNNLQRFYLKHYVSLEVTPVAVFQSQMESFIEQFQSSTKKEFLTVLRTVQDVIQANLFFTTTQSNGVVYFLSENSRYAHFFDNVYDECSCFYSDKCTSSAAFYDGILGPKLFDVPGMKIGCFIIQALLQSSLECFYDHTCLNTLSTFYMNGSVLIINALNTTQNSHFETTSTINEMLDELFVEKWKHSIKSEKYFIECLPKYCTFTVKSRVNTVYVITTILGLVGGLKTALTLILPRLVKWIRQKRRREQPETEVVLDRWLSTLMRQITQELRQINLFAEIPPSTDQHELKNQLISTRLFIVSFASSLMILIVYTSTISVMETGKLTKPTLEQYKDLYDKYSATLSCPCTEIAVDYEKFLRVEFSQHQICSSYLVSDQLIGHLLAAFEKITFFSLDFRISGLFVFQALRALCNLANDRIVNSLSRLNTNRYIRIDVTPAPLFESETKSIFEAFRASTINEFSSSLNLVREMAQANFYSSVHQTNALIYRSSAPVQYSFVARSYGNCSCLLESTCTRPAGFYNGLLDEMLFEIDGLKIGCSVIGALLQSNLNCFYNNTCFTQLNGWLDNILVNVPVFESNTESRFTPMSTVEELSHELFVEKWNFTARYADYYSVCAPTQCSFTVKTRNTVMTIIVMVIGLVGGLVTGLQLLIPLLINFIRKKKDPRAPIRGDFGSETSADLRQIFNKIWQLNLFTSKPPETDPHQIRTQIISTRIYVILLTSAIVILTIYTAAIPITETEVQQSPGLEEYLQLYEKYSLTLVCPCKHIAVPYEAFLEINYTLHQVCSSYFVTSAWLYHLRNSWINEATLVFGFRKIGPSQFQALASLCNLVNDTIINSRIDFYATRYVSMHVPPINFFQSQILLQTNAFQAFTTRQFLSSLKVVRDTAQANNLFSALETNARISFLPDSFYATITARQYGNCTCFGKPTCIFPALLYNGSNFQTLFCVYGFHVGCYPVEALLQSHFGCFYDITCFAKLASFFSENTIQEKSFVMNSSVPSRFKVTSTVDELLEEIMVENWTQSIRYSDYFDACQPTHCTYQIKTKNSAVVIIVTVTGLIGGLTSVLDIVIPYVVRLAYYMIRRRNRIRPTADPNHLVVEDLKY